MTSLGDLFWTIRGDTTELEKDVDKSIVSAGRKLEDRGKKLTAGVTLPLLALAGQGVKAFSDVEKGLREVVTLTGQAGAEAEATFATFSEGVSRLSDELDVAQGELVDGLYSALSAGVPTENAFSFLETAARAGIAGVATTEEAVDGITSAINAFGLEFSEADRVADVFFSTVRAGKTTLSEIAANIGKIAPVANLAGISLEEVGAALSTLTANGLTTSQAATQIKASIDAITAPTEEITAAFVEAGFATGQAAIESVGYQGALDVLFDSVNGNLGELKALVGTQEAVGATAIIAGSGAEKFANDLDAATSAAGAAATAFEEIDKARDFERFLNDARQLSLELGEALLPVAKGIAAGLREFGAGLRLIPEGLLVSIGAVAAVAGPAQIALGKLLQTGKSLSTLKLATGIGAFGGPAGLAAVAGIAAVGVALGQSAKEAAEARERATLYAAAIDEAVPPTERLEAKVNRLKDAYAGLAPEIEGATDAIAVPPDVAAFDDVVSTLSDGTQDVVAEFQALGGEIEDIAAGGLSGTDLFDSDGSRISTFIEEIEGRAISAEEAVGNLVERAEETGDENIIRAARAFQQYGEQVDFSRDKLKRLADAIDENADAFDDAQASREAEARELVNSAIRTGELSAEVGELARAYEEAGESSTPYLDAVDEFDRKARLAATAQSDLDRIFRDGSGGPATYAQQLDEVVEALDRVEGHPLGNTSSSGLKFEVEAFFAGEEAFFAELDRIGETLDASLSSALDIDTADGVNDVQNAIDNIGGAIGEAGESLATLQERVDAIAALRNELGPSLGIDFSNLIGQIASGSADGLLDDILFGEGGTTPDILGDLEAQLQEAEDLKVELGIELPPEEFDEFADQYERAFTEAAEGGLGRFSEIIEAAEVPELTIETNGDEIRTEADEIVAYYLEQNPELTVTVNYVEGFGAQFNAPDGFETPDIFGRAFGGPLPPNAIVDVGEIRPERIVTDAVGRGFVFPSTPIVEEQDAPAGGPVIGELTINEAASPASTGDEVMRALYLAGVG